MKYILDVTTLARHKRQGGIESVTLDIYEALKLKGKVRLVAFSDMNYWEFNFNSQRSSTHQVNEVVCVNKKKYISELIKFRLPSWFRYFLGFLKFNFWVENFSQESKNLIVVEEDDCLVLPEVILNKRHLQFIHSRIAKGTKVSAVVHDLIALEDKKYAPMEIRYAFKKYLDTAICAENIFTPSFFVANQLKAYKSSGHDVQIPKIKTIKPRIRNIFPFDQNCATCKFDGIQILYVSSFVRRKNHLQTIELFSEFALKFGKKIRLIFVAGSGNMQNIVLRKAIQSKNAFFEVKILRDLEDCCLSSLYADVDLVAYFSKAEGYGMPVADALSLGLPVLCLDLPVFRELGTSKRLFVLPDLSLEVLLNSVPKALEPSDPNYEFLNNKPRNPWQQMKI